MLPKWHIFLGGLFTAAIWAIAPKTNPIYLTLLFLASFMIDFDHYLDSLIKTKKASLKHAFQYHEKIMKQEEEEHRKKIRKRGSFHIFHTIEFHVLVAVLSLFHIAFLYILIGMIFHSLLDVVWLLRKDRIYRREFFFFNWARKRI